jgi:NADH:ubiquinone oxidoreductase subunit F (NADH-binding)
VEPRLLLDVSPERMTYEHHRGLHGPLPASAAGRRLQQELARAGLRGRGGGAFPIGVKLDAVSRAKGSPLVVANGCEGEPMSAKDRVLMQCLPHLVIDGAICCARATDAGDVFFTLDDTADDAYASLTAALAERPELRRRKDRVHVVRVPRAYITGQEAALVSLLSGGEAKPRHMPTRVTERGVDQRPTLVSNVETLAHVALIARHGADWYRTVGQPDDPGSSLITIGGAVRYPGVYEVEHGATLGSVIDDAGGVSEPARAYLIGGYAGTWVDGVAAAGVRLSNPQLGPLGASLGPGIVVALPESSCPVAETVRVATWLSDESAGQCGPCVRGLGAISGTLGDMNTGRAGRDAYRDLARWSQLVTGRGACAHPDGAARFVTSSLHTFAAEFDDHARYGICDACDRRPVLDTPSRRLLAA